MQDEIGESLDESVAFSEADDSIEVFGSDNEVVIEEPQADEQDDDAADAADDSDEDEGAEADKPKKAKGVQKRIDELTANWRAAERRAEALEAREQARFDRENAAPVVQSAAPDPKQYADGDLDPKYFEALADHRADLKIQAVLKQQAETAKQESARAEANRRATEFTEKAAAAGESGVSALELAQDPNAPVTPVMADIIRSSELGVEIAAHLHTHRSDLTRIAALPEPMQAYEMARIEASLSKPKAPKTAQAKPKQVEATPTVAGRTGAGVSKPLDQMSQAEYEAWSNKKTSPQSNGWV
jgi:hypothetical protein